MPSSTATQPSKIPLSTLNRMIEVLEGKGLTPELAEKIASSYKVAGCVVKTARDTYPGIEHHPGYCL